MRHSGAVTPFSWRQCAAQLQPRAEFVPALLSFYRSCNVPSDAAKMYSIARYELGLTSYHMEQSVSTHSNSGFNGHL